MITLDIWDFKTDIGPKFEFEVREIYMTIWSWHNCVEHFVRICVCPTSPSCWAVIVYKCGLGTLSLWASFWGWVLPKPVYHGIRAPRFVVWRRCWVWTPAYLVGTLGVRAGVRICVCPTSPSCWAVIVYKCGLGTLSLWASFWGWVLPKPVYHLGSFTDVSNWRLYNSNNFKFT